MPDSTVDLYGPLSLETYLSLISRKKTSLYVDTYELIPSWDFVEGMEDSMGTNYSGSIDLGPDSSSRGTVSWTVPSVNLRL